MFKKVFGLMITLLMIATNCFAMTFSQPVKIGHAGGKPYVGQTSHFKGGYFIEGTSYNSGNRVTHGSNLANTVTYDKGLARWGEGKDALYCKYDSHTPADSRGISYGLKFGGKENYVLSESSWREIYKIETDEGITLYPLYFHYKYFNKLDIIVVRQDGTWVKYIDIGQVAEKYFGKKSGLSELLLYGYGEVKDSVESMWVRENIISCQDDTIIIPYTLFVNSKPSQHGEFRFKWDDAAQWFSVEKITY